MMLGRAIILVHDSSSPVRTRSHSSNVNEVDSGVVQWDLGKVQSLSRLKMSCGTVGAHKSVESRQGK